MTLHCRYHRNRRAKGSRSRRLCSQCYYRWYTKHRRSKSVARAEHLKRKYGLTVAEFHKLWIDQGQVCAICGLPPKSSPHVDHDHGTGKVRGILCSPCNLGLGIFKDSIPRLRAAATYLEKRK